MKTRTFSFDVRVGKDQISYLVNASDFASAYIKFSKAYPKAVKNVKSVWYASGERLPVIVK